MRFLQSRRFWVCTATCLLLLLWGRWVYHRYVDPWWYVSGRWYFIQRQAERATREKPNEIDSWTMLGCARYWRKDPEGALLAYQKAFTLAEGHPAQPTIQWTIADIQRDLRRWDDALATFSNLLIVAEQLEDSTFAPRVRVQIDLVRQDKENSTN